jgi:hypothetical protein
MWHRDYVGVVFNDAADVPTDLPYEVPTTATQPVEGLELAHWSDF